MDAWDAERVEHREIDTRDELIAALEVAAELEHGLMVQYLFAAFSAKTLPRHHSRPEYVDMVRDWLRDIYIVSRQEMAHLATVCNLLAAVGGAPHFTRPPFPSPAGRYFPGPGFSLGRLSAESLNRFVAFEAPETTPLAGKGDDDPAWGAMSRLHAQPDLLVYSSVGGLYRMIRRGFEVLEARLRSRLFIGSPNLQDDQTWTASLRIRRVTDLASAVAAIDGIVLEGEGTPNQKPSASSPTHHARFLAAFQAHADADSRDKGFKSSWPVVPNPVTRLGPERERHGATLLTADTLAYECAEVFNGAYTLALHLLVSYFDPAGETVDRRRRVGFVAKQVMSGMLRPLGEILACLPADGCDVSKTAGAPFEIYGSLQLPSDARTREIMFAERAELLARVCRCVAERARASKDEDTHRVAGRLFFLTRNFELLFVRLTRGDGAL